MNPKPILALGALLISTGCTLAPRFTRPPSAVPETWSKGDKSGPVAADLQWRDFLTDPGMRAVVDLTLAHNLDLKVAVLNVEKTQAAYRIQRGELMPTLGMQGTSTNYRISEKQASSGEASIVRQNTAYVAGLSWELDFFGRIRSLKDQALNQYLATEQAQAATRIALVTTVAQAYLQYAADAENLNLAQSTLEAQKATYELVTKSYELGMASELTLRQSQSQVDSARADVARYRGLLALDQNALDLLAGTPVPPGMLPKGLGTLTELKDVSAGLPSEVLLRRPDILMAEYQLKAANANIGAARAAFFPNISLTAGVGSMSPEVSSLFHSGTRTWSFTPT
ncbi:MAG: multidrug transporter, partial [Holophagaceae bacterium]|nr:multidrug transporter [Holophagaceae bacterium]